MVKRMIVSSFETLTVKYVSKEPFIESDRRDLSTIIKCVYMYVYINERERRHSYNITYYNLNILTEIVNNKIPSD